MKTLSAGLQEALNSGATTLCRCWKLIRSDGVVMGFTDHDEDLVFDGVTYSAASGFTASAMDQSLGLNVDGLEVQGALIDDALSEDGLAAGQFDNASVTIYLADWKAPDNRTILFAGSIGEVSRGSTHFAAEIRGLAHALNQPRGRLYQRSCDADLGDNRCKINLLGNADIDEIASDAWDALLRFERSYIHNEGMNLKFTDPAGGLGSYVYDYSYTGIVRGHVQGAASPEYQVRLVVTTDIDYQISTVNIGVDGTFQFAWAPTGGKVLEIIQVSSGDVVHRIETSIGLLRSFTLSDDVTGSLFQSLKDRCFIYDQAVALIAACCRGDGTKAREWAAGLIEAQDADGHWKFSVNRISGFFPDAYYRTGAESWAAYALIFYARKFTGSDIRVAALDAARSFLDVAIAEYLVTDAGDHRHGLYTGGTGRYVMPSYVFEPGYIVPWSATEHNIDMYFALDLAGEEIDPVYDTKAASLKSAILDRLWNEEDGRLIQGVMASGPDMASALDQHSWGIAFLQHVSENAKAVRAINWMERFKFNEAHAWGYTPYLPEYGYPGVTKGVWGEGTHGVVLARLALGQVDVASIAFAHVSPLLDENGFLYTTRRDETYELQPWYAVASTAWAIMAHDPQGFWGVDSKLNSGTYPILLESAFATIGTVETVSGKKLTISTSGSFESGWCQSGLMTVLSGANVNLIFEIKTSEQISSGTQEIALWETPVQNLETSDRVYLQAGCDKSFTTCRERFDNAVNFRGFPFMPGNDWVTSYPNKGEGNDGGALRAPA